MDDLIPTNKYPHDAEADTGVGANAKALEEMSKKIDWKYMGIAYGIGFSIFLVSLFLLLIVIRGAFMIF